MKKAVFLDKDGTLIPDIPYNVDPAKITISDEAAEGLKLLQDNHFLLVMITNQSGVARGYFEEEKLATVFQTINELLKKKHVTIDAFYYCPHHPAGKVERYSMDCDCRKPRPGLITRAAKELDIDLAGSWMIGDILNDVEAGNRAGCHTVLVDNGNETEWISNEYRTPFFIVKDINEAARYILKTDNSTQYEKELAGV